MARVGCFDMLFGTNNTGKSTVLKDLLTINNRNLIIPADRSDSNWDGVKEIDLEKIMYKFGFDDWEVFFRQSNKPEIIQMQTTFKYIVAQELHQFKGNRKIYIEHPELFKILLHKKYGYRRGGFFWDDYKHYIPNDKLPDYVKNGISDRRFREWDLFAAVHSPTQAPPDMFVYNPTIYLFKTTDKFERAKGKIAKYDELVAMQERVNLKSKTNPYYFEILE